MLHPTTSAPPPEAPRDPDAARRPLTDDAGARAFAALVRPDEAGHETNDPACERPMTTNIVTTKPEPAELAVAAPASAGAPDEVAAPASEPRTAASPTIRGRGPALLAPAAAPDGAEAIMPALAPTRSTGPASPPHAGPAPVEASEPTRRIASNPTPVPAQTTPASAPSAGAASSEPSPAFALSTPTTPASPGTPASHPVATTPDAPAITAQVARAIVTRGPAETLEVRLDPPQLGRVQIAFDFAADTPRAVVSASQPETLDLLRRNAPLLVQELNEAGLGEADIEWSDAPMPDREDRAEERIALARPVAPDADASEPPIPRPARHDGALDLTL